MKSASLRKQIDQTPLELAPLQSEFVMGIGMSADPDNANPPNLALLNTTIHSQWFARNCPVCGDRFREGDRVRRCPQCGEPYHDDDRYGLHCWQDHFANGGVCRGRRAALSTDLGEKIVTCSFIWNGDLPEVQIGFAASNSQHTIHSSPEVNLVEQFVDGVESIWNPHGGQKSVKVTVNSPIVGRKCPWCRFRVRVGDWVVACPCTTNCGTFFHQDVFRHLTCWNEWNGGGGNDFCPSTGAQILRDSRS